jgi:CheY-like chemotaxis protein
VSNLPILPYYHPTTVVIVDDNDLFLHTLDLRMPSEMAYQLFHDARVALQRVNRGQSCPSIPERSLSAIRSGSSWRDSVIRLDLSVIEDEINNQGRFGRVSVVIVDYAMPEMNGLEFCRRITDPMIKKVLLTGVADEKLAVKAFNEGSIDRFIPKNSPGTLDLVVAFAQDLQQSYFVDQQRAFSESLSLTPPRFLSDRAMAQHFEALRDQSEVVEHYLVGDPPGFLMLTSAGQILRMVVLSEPEAERQVEFAERFGAPRSVIEELVDRRRIAFFFETPDPLGDAFSWGEYLHPAQTVRGDGQTWHIALISGPPIDIDFDASISSFDAYLDGIDHLALG